MKPILACMLSISGTILSDEEKYLLNRTNPLGICLFKRNIQNKNQVIQLIKEIKECIQRDDVLIATDQEGGRVCRFCGYEFYPLASQSLIGALSAPQREEIASIHAYLIARDLKMSGVNMDFAPCLDIAYQNTTPALKSRCLSSDKTIVAECGKIILNTFKNEGLISCVKHAPGHGRSVVDPHLNLPVLDCSLDELENDFYPFIQTAPFTDFMMTAHIVIPQIDAKPITHSYKAIQEIIRKKMNFKGLIISDAIDMKALKGTLAQKTQNALNASCDVICYCLGDIDELKEVTDACAPLSDNALEYFKTHITPTLQKDLSAIDKKTLFEKEQKYTHFLKNAPAIADDYDAVEVLNKLKTKIS